VIQASHAESNGDPAPVADPQPILDLDGCAVALGKRTLWSDVTLQVQAGEFVCILGPNGVGKSTMIKAVLGQASLSTGRMRVLGRPPGQANQRIGYLPQRRSFDDQLRVRGLDVVRLGLDGGRWGMPLPGATRFSPRARAAADRIAQVIDLVGATPYARRPIGELSGGEQQRLLIAQALASRPRLLLLDEPLDSLDLPNQGAIARLVSDICRSEQIAVVMVAHDVNPILAYLDRVIYLARGSALIGPPREVITTATLTRLYDSPVEVLRTGDDRLVVVGTPEAPAYHHDRHPDPHPDRAR
jgi:zinc/manganese transport system ATP-binding protein